MGCPLYPRSGNSPRAHHRGIVHDEPYQGKRYHLTQIAIESGGKEPKPAALAGLIKKANQEDIKVIFISPGFSQKSAQLIAEQTGAKLIEIDHLSKDWLNNMYKIAQIFKNCSNI